MSFLREAKGLDAELARLMRRGSSRVSPKQFFLVCALLNVKPQARLSDLKKTGDIEVQLAHIDLESACVLLATCRRCSSGRRPKTRLAKEVSSISPCPLIPALAMPISLADVVLDLPLSFAH